MQRLGGLQHVKQLRVINLQQHASDFPSEVGVKCLDQRVQPLTFKTRCAQQEDRL